MPSPQRGQLLLKVRAVSLNYRDIAIARGEYPKSTSMVSREAVGYDCPTPCPTRQAPRCRVRPPRCGPHWVVRCRSAQGRPYLTLGSGGVSVFGIQLAKALGARVVATTSSAAKGDILRNLGADDVIDYPEFTDWGDRVRELTEDRGVERILEVGVRPPSNSRCVRSPTEAR